MSSSLAAASSSSSSSSSSADDDDEQFAPEVAAADALIAAVEAESDEEEEDAPAPVDEIPFGTQDQVDEAMKHSRTEKTLRSYEVSVNAMLTWCKQHQDEEMVKAVLKTGADGDI